MRLGLNLDGALAEAASYLKSRPKYYPKNAYDNTIIAKIVTEAGDIWYAMFVDTQDLTRFDKDSTTRVYYMKYLDHVNGNGEWNENC